VAELLEHPEWLQCWAQMACHANVLPIQDHKSSLSAAESRLIANAHQPRIESFSTGRRCAHGALLHIGMDTVELLRQSDGSVLWPGTCTGSISHCTDLAIALVTNDPQVISVGVDIERTAPFDRDVLELVSSADEQRWLSRENIPQWVATALFSIKESLFKCLNPITSLWFDFDSVSVRNSDSWIIEPEGDGRLSGQHGLTGYVRQYRNIQVTLLDDELRHALMEFTGSKGLQACLKINLALFEQHVVSLVWLAADVQQTEA
jgi:4'-phosphopantetheinyl transferase EntD